MAITLDSATSSGEQTGASSITFAHTVAGSNRLLVVGTHVRDATQAHLPITGITYNSVALTKVRHDEFFDTAGGRTEIWYLIAPDTGTNNVIVSFTDVIDHLSCYAISFTGAHQTTPLVGNNGAAGRPVSPTSSTVSVTTTADNAYIVDAIYEFDAPPVTEGASQTVIHSLSPNGDGDVAAGSRQVVGAAGSYDMVWTWDTGSERYMHSVAAFAPSAGSASLSPSSSSSASLSPSSSSSASRSPSSSSSASLSPSASSSISLSPSASVSPSAGSAPMVKVWTGASWELKPLKYWGGSSWL